MQLYLPVLGHSPVFAILPPVIDLYFFLSPNVPSTMFHEFRCPFVNDFTGFA